MGKYKASFNAMGLSWQSKFVTFSAWTVSGALSYFLATAVPDSVSRSYLLHPGQQRANPCVKPWEPWVPTTFTETHNANLRKVLIQEPF